MKQFFSNTLRLGLFAGALALSLAWGHAQAQVITDPIVPLDHPHAPFLESRAFAQQAGATAEFRKMEWVAVDPVNARVYWAMSEVSKGMSDGEGDVNVTENMCGIVYVGEYDESYNVSRISPLIVGGPYDEANRENRCAVNNIANPDNLTVDADGRLWIGEDSANHANNVLWMYDGDLHRFATLPAGAESTGVHIAPDGSLFFNVQHPSGRNPHPFNRGLVGVVEGFKVSDEFTEVGAPEGPDARRVVVAGGEYTILGRVGNVIPDEVMGNRFGQVNDVHGEPMFMCNLPDGNMYLPTVEDGSEGYLYTNFECEPAAVSRIYIRSGAEGWEVVEGTSVDFSAVNGGWNLCGSSVTPWNSALTSEEHEPFASPASWKRNVAPMSDYLGEQANPYDYGWLIEMMPDEDGNLINSLAQKQYAMGRFSHENAVILPDGKTAYHGDDGTDVVFFKTVAAEAGDLSAGAIYAAKVTQLEDESFELEWIKLGAATSDEIAETILTLDLPE
jgi:secreted PhoX family phosphatase